MTSSFKFGLLLAGAALCGPQGLLAGSHFGYRIDFPDAPLPVAQATNAWVLDNLTSVAITAGGHGAINNLPNNQPVFPTNAPVQPHPGYVPEYQLVNSSFGHAVSGDKPDLYLGQAIAAPLADLPAGWYIHWAGMTNAAIAPAGHAFYEPSSQQVYVLAGGAVTVSWIITDGQSLTNLDYTYLVSSAPAGRPFRVYWTEAPYNGPTVNLRDRHVKFHWNEDIPAPEKGPVEMNGTIMTNVVRGLWLDAGGQLHVAPGLPGQEDLQGLVVMQYFKTGDLKEQVPGGLVVIEVARPQVNDLPAAIGERLLPQDGPFGHDGLTARITRGHENPSQVYQHEGQYTHSPKQGWVFPIRRTVDAPWSIEIYWEEADAMGTLWPYELDWYAAEWPADAQVFVRGTGGNLGANIPIARELAPTLMDFQEPPGHATLTPDGIFQTSGEGYCLLRFQANDDLWFQAVRSVFNTNAMFDRQPRPWTIGEEIGPGVSSDALDFNGLSDFVVVTNLPALTNAFTVECWFQSPHPNDGYRKTLLARETPLGDAGPEALGFKLQVDENGELVGWVQTQFSTLATLATSPLEQGRWYHAALTAASNRASLFLDGQLADSSDWPTRPLSPATAPLLIGQSEREPDRPDYFRGQLDEIRVWSQARTAEEIALGLENFLHDYATADGLVAYYPVELTDTGVLHEWRHGYDGRLSGCQHVEPGATGLLEREGFSEYHGYIYDPQGRAPYNAALYAYPEAQNPEAESYVFAVNSGQIEVWWSHKIQEPGMTHAVYFPAWAQVFTNLWPANTPEIVLASGQGSPAFQSATVPSIYVQNDPTLAGFNPNEEHALVSQEHGAYAAFALRDDLNPAGLSQPFVLVDYQEPATGKAAMKVFHVVRTNAEFPAFTFATLAGRPLQGPHPLDFLPYVTPTTSPSPLAWRDRKRVWWAVGAGPGDTDTAEIVKHDFYPMQEGFWFPGLNVSQQPAFGTPIPWLPAGSVSFSNPAYPTNGTPVPVTWVVGWPQDVPSMFVGQTLTRPVNGLPEIWSQLSVEVPFQQSTNLGSGPSVKLFDPTIERGVSLPRALAEYAFTTGPHGTIYDRRGHVYFYNLPPDLSGRLYYDPNRATDPLRFIGQLIEPKTGPGFLLVNRLTDRQRDEIKAICTISDAIKKGEWDAAIDRLATNIVEVGPNQPFDHLALAAVGTGAGYVTLAFNNATNPAVGVHEGDPISVQVIRVRPQLYTGFLIPLSDELNLLSEQMNMLFSESFGGAAGLYQFQWRAQEPTLQGGVPQDPGVAPLYAQDAGLTRLRIGGEGAALTDMVDRFFTVRYRALDPSVVAMVGTNWSPYTEFNLSEGWVQHVLNALTPFEQRRRDLYSNAAETQSSMIALAGPPYAGDVALNMESISGVGLIQLYQTILNRARHLSLDLGINNAAVNQQLLLAASRLQALYMLLGNEAYADALDPTIGFGSQTVIPSGTVLPVDYGAFASSLFCFDNQVPTLLDEELALLRGRGDTNVAPGVNHYPYYNRLVWNFTKGIDAGEVAYAVNYNIRDPQAVIINADTAAELFPQGHGDAWGHYLSALKGYYHLLRNPHFNWGDPSITPMLIGYQVISSETKDEARFAEAAAALVRTGTEIVRRAYRKTYTEDAHTTVTDSVDSNPGRAWGVSEWSARAGQSALYNWAVCQSLLPVASTNRSVEADLTRIDRSTVKADDEIAANYRSIQSEADHVDQGLNPLGLSQQAVPFDISPAEIDAGRTHFQQIYDRAVAALGNAQVAFDGAQEAARLLRQQSENALNFEEAMLGQESDYNNRLIQIFGSPYPEDMGPGATYPQDYVGPDLYHFPYMDLQALGFDPTTEIGQITITNYVFPGTFLEKSQGTWDAIRDNTPVISPILEFADMMLDSGDDPALPSTNVTVSYHFAANGMVAKPAAWGQRASPGEVQQAYGEYLVKLLELRAGLRELSADAERLNEKYHWYYADAVGWHDVQHYEQQIAATTNSQAVLTAAVETWGRMQANYTKSLAGMQESMQQVISRSLPGSLIIGMANGGDTLSGVKASLYGVGYTIQQVAKIAFLAKENYWEMFKLANTVSQSEYQVQTIKREIQLADQEMRNSILDLARQQETTVARLFAALQEVEQAREHCLSVVSDGERLLAERESVRTSAANRVAAGRYQDMAFRIFRNDALRRYSDAFELAARYTYLTAKAYDYETGLLASDNDFDAGAVFFKDIIRSRTIGRLVGGQPALAATRIGEPGLSDVLARLNANWSVLQGRLGFNNPQTETSRFSLRTELFRIAPGTEGDARWRQVLEQATVDNLLDHPAFRRYCLPFASQSGLQDHEPGLVIPFSSTIDFAKNFFGRDLAGGDGAYDSSHFATKIRSVGVWFTDYDRVSDGSQDVYLANQPRVYLIPVGLDVMRSPTDLGESLRLWQVLDQAIPVPFPATPEEVTQPDWIPLYDTLAAPWAQARRYPSLRAYHDRGFNASEMTYNSRLIGRSVWNTQWLLIIPAGTLHSDRAHALDWFIYGGTGEGGVSDIKLFFQTYSYAGH